MGSRDAGRLKWPRGRVTIDVSLVAVGVNEIYTLLSNAPPDHTNGLPIHFSAAGNAFDQQALRPHEVLDRAICPMDIIEHAYQVLAAQPLQRFGQGDHHNLSTIHSAAANQL